MTTLVQLSEWIEAGLLHPLTVESSSCLMIPNEQTMREANIEYHKQHPGYQYQQPRSIPEVDWEECARRRQERLKVGDSVRLERLCCNVLGLAAVGKLGNPEAAWNSYKHNEGSSIEEATRYIASLLGIPYELADKMSRWHCDSGLTSAREMIELLRDNAF